MYTNYMYCKNKFKKAVSFVLCIMIIASSCVSIAFAETTYPNDEEITVGISNSTDPSYIVTNSGASVWKSRKNINGTLAVFSVPVPSIRDNQTIKNFKFKFTTTHQQGYADAFTVYNLPGKWNPASMKLSDVTAILADSANKVSNIVSEKNNGGFAWPALDNVADITEFAQKAHENNISHVYIGVMASNSTEIFGTDLYLSDFTQGLYPYEAFTLTEMQVSDDDEYVFKTPSSAQIEADIRQKLLNKSHPFIHADSGKLTSIKNAVKSGSDEFIVEEYEQTLAEANSLISQPVLNHGKNVTQDAVYVRGRILSLMTVYYVQGGEAYLTRAMSEFENLQTIETWDVASQLDNTMTMEAIATCYDWLYDYLSESQRLWAETVIKEKGLSIAYEYFKDPSCLSSLREQHNNSNIVLARGTFNHTVYNNSNLLIAALAIAKKDPAYSAFIISNCLYNLEPYWELVKDGGFEEPVTYYNYCSGKTVFAMSALYSSLGTMYGYEKSPGFKNTAWYPIYMYGPFTFGDSHAKKGSFSTNILYFYAKHSKNNQMLKKIVESDAGSPVDVLLWYDSGDLDAIENAPELPPDRLFATAEQSTAVFRNHFDDSCNIFTGLYAGCGNATGHSDAVSGIFCLDAFGERFITALGVGDYNLPGYFDNSQNGGRWDYYERRTEGGNCLVINPDRGVGQDVTASAVISSFESGEGSAFAIADLTSVYPDAKNYKRGLKLYKNRSAVLVQDEAKLKKPSEIFWSFNTPAKIEITSDSTAILSIGAKKVAVKISANVPFELFEMKAESLPSSPSSTYQKEFPEYRKLAVSAKDVEELKLTAEFTPVVSENEIDVKPCEYVDLSEWMADEASYALPEISGIKINGELIKDFKGKNHFYKINANNFTSIPEITPVCENGISCEVVYPESLPGIGYIYAKSGEANSSYAISFTTSTEKEKVTELSHYQYPSYYVTKSSSTTWQSGNALIRNGAAIYTIPLPDKSEGETITDFKFKFSTLGNSGYSFKLINIPGSINPSSLTLAAIENELNNSENLVGSENINSEKNEKYTQSVGSVAYTSIADITEYAKKAYESGEKYLYMALTSEWTVSAFSTLPYSSNGEGAFGILPGYRYSLGESTAFELVSSSHKDGERDAKFTSEINYLYSKPLKNVWAYVNGEKADTVINGSKVSVYIPDVESKTIYEIRLAAFDYSNQYTSDATEFSLCSDFAESDIRSGNAWHITQSEDPVRYGIDSKSIRYLSGNFTLFELPVPKLPDGYDLSSFTLETYVGKNDSVYALKFPGEDWCLNASENETALRFGDEKTMPIISDWYSNGSDSKYIAYDSVSYKDNRATFELKTYMDECMKNGQQKMYVALISKYYAGAWGFSVTSSGSARCSYSADLKEEVFSVMPLKLCRAKDSILDYHNAEEINLPDKNTSYKILSEYTNLTGEDKSVKLFAVTYNDSGLISDVRCICDRSLSSDAVSHLVESDEFTAGECDNIKIFMWYNNSVQPIGKSNSYKSE